MNREILFKGFCPSDNGNQIITLGGKDIRGDWMFGDVQHNICTTKIREQEKDVERIAKSYAVLPYTVCQYTGLIDKNGKRIWEGDVFKGAGTYNLTVFWYKNNAMFYAEYKGLTSGHEDDDFDIETPACDFEYCEVIGDKFNTRSVEE